MRLRAEFWREGQELPLPTFLDEEKDPSKAQPQLSRTLISKKVGGRGIQFTRRARPSVSEVGENHHNSKPLRDCKECGKHPQKRHRYDQSLEHTRHTSHPKQTRLIEIGSFAKWIHGVTPDPSLKIPQFVLYSSQSRPLEHVYYYKSAMRLVTNDEAILRKAFSSTLADKALTWFTSLKRGTTDSWHTLEKLFLDKFNTSIPKTRGDLANIKQMEDESLLSYLDDSRKLTM